MWKSMKKVEKEEKINETYTWYSEWSIEFASLYLYYKIEKMYIINIRNKRVKFPSFLRPVYLKRKAQSTA